MRPIRRESFKAASSIIAVTVAGSACVVPNAQAAAPTLNATATYQVPPEAIKPIGIFDFRDPNTSELIRFQYQPSTKEELRKFAPSKVRTISLNPPKGKGFAGAAAQLALDFPAEYLAFTMAQALNISFHLENDPMFAQNFVSQNTSPEGVISFAGFVAASRASHAMLQAFGVAYNPAKAPLNYRLETPFTRGQAIVQSSISKTGEISFQAIGQTPGRPDYLNTNYVGRPVGPTRFQRAFAPLLGPIGLAAGMTTSNIIHELMADKNLRICSSTPKGKDEEALKLAEAAKIEACDKFWEDWAIGKKAADWAPDILAMGSASLIQAYIVNKGIIGGAKWTAKQGLVAGAAKAGVTVGANQMSGRLEIQAVKAGAEKVIPWVLRGVRVANVAVGAHPVGRFAMTVGNIWVFMEIVHPITPLLKKPFEQSRQGRDITARVNAVFEELGRAEKNQWVWAPRPESEFCTGFETDIMGMPTPNTNCLVPEQHDPAFLLKKMAERQAKWREFILQDAYLAHTNWQTYVGGFGVMYANATAFYEQMIAHLNYQKFSPAAKNRPSYLFQAEPFFGLYTDPTRRSRAEGREAVMATRAWLETYLEGARLKARTSRYRMHSTEAAVLPQILTGLRALDPEVSLASLNSAEASFRNLDKMTPEQRVEFETRARERLLENAIHQLRKVLSKDIVYKDTGLQLGTPLYKTMAETNPFMAIRMRLGDPEPLLAGVAFVRGSNDDQTIIEQESKANHPGAIGRVRTNTMADFLAVSMVCGPEADPKFSDSQKIEIYKKTKLSFFERTLQNLGLGSRTINANDEQVLIAVREFTEEKTKAQKNWYHIFSQNAVATEWAGFSADFRPPRIVDGVPDSLCQNFALNSNRDLSFYDPYEAQFKIGNETYEGILDIIRKRARPEIVGTSLPPSDQNVKYDDPFDKWWKAFVDKHVTGMIAKFRASYREVLKDKYIPALTKNGTGGSAEYNGRSIKLGALAALYDEANLYLLILGKTSKVTKDAVAKKAYTDLSSAILLEFKNMGELTTDLEFVEQKGEIAKAAYELKRTALDSKLTELKKFADSREKADNATADIQKINEQVFKNLNGLLGEMDSYWGIIRAIQVVGQ